MIKIKDIGEFISGSWTCMIEYCKGSEEEPLPQGCDDTKTANIVVPIVGYTILAICGLIILL